MESYLVWYISAGLLLITEAFTPGLFLFICFALAAFITGFIVSPDICLGKLWDKK